MLRLLVDENFNGDIVKFETRRWRGSVMAEAIEYLAAPQFNVGNSTTDKRRSERA